MVSIGELARTHNGVKEGINTDAHSIDLRFSIWPALKTLIVEAYNNEMRAHFMKMRGLSNGRI